MHKRESASLQKERKFFEIPGVIYLNTPMKPLDKLEHVAKNASLDSSQMVSKIIFDLPFDLTEKTVKAKKSLPPLKSLINKGMIPLYNNIISSHRGSKEIFKKFSNPKFYSKPEDEDKIYLEISGLQNLRKSPVIEDSLKNKKIIESEARRKTILFLEKERQQRIYEKYLQKIEYINKIREQKYSKMRSKSNRNKYSDDYSNRVEISLQTVNYVEENQ